MEVPRDIIVVFLGDTWIFDVHTSEWTEVITPSMPTRSELDMVYDPVIDQVVIYGGQDGASIFDELWFFSPSDLTWKTLENNLGDAGGWISEQSMVYDSGRNQTFFFGGGDQDAQDEVDWMWSLTFEENVREGLTVSPTEYETTTLAQTESSQQSSAEETPVIGIMAITILPLFKRKNNK